MKPHRIVIVTALYGVMGALVACAPKSTEAPPYNIEFPLNEVMGHLIDPAAQVYWHSSGTITTAEGEQSLTPTTEEGWLAAENAMTTVAEAGNLLMLPGRARDNGEWMQLAKQMTDVALTAKAAVLAKDEKGMFDTGGKLYEVCTACHEKYLLPFLGPDGKPGKLGPDGKPNPLYHGDDAAPTK